MKNGTSDQIIGALQAFGIEPAAGSVARRRDGITFRFQSPREARRVLKSRMLFSEGPLGILHGRDVGGLATEFRSFAHHLDCSLHVVMGKNGSAFAHLDRYNPYQGPIPFILHGLLELLPHLACQCFALLRLKQPASPDAAAGD